MKKIFSTIVCFAIGLLAYGQTYVWKDGKIEGVFTSCEIRFTKVPAQNFDSLSSIVEMNNSLYRMFGQDKSFRNRLACGYQGYNTDIEHGMKNSGTADYCIYTMTPSGWDLSTSNNKDPWGYLSQMVYNASAIIEGIEANCDTTSHAYAYCLGEAIFLRAFALSEMVKLWGDVPTTWRWHGVFFLPTQSKQERNLVYEMIRSDLKRAADLLPWADQMPHFDRSAVGYREPTSKVSANDTYMEHPANFSNYTGAPTKAAALALLARTNLNYAGYAMKPNRLGFPEDGFCIQLNIMDQEKRRALHKETIEACAQIIQHEGAYKLLPRFEDIFKNICADVTDYSQSEVIWEIAFADGMRGQVLQYNSPKMSDALLGLKNNRSGASNAAVAAVPTLYFDYEDGDARRDVTIAPYSWVYDDGSRLTSYEEQLALAFPQVDVAGKEKFLYQKLSNIDAWYFGKYRTEWMSRERDSYDDGVNYPIVRYADVVLMFCEASLGGITGDVPQNTTEISAQSLFDAIRARANLRSKPLTMQRLMDERKYEFAGEALRKYDLMRWGKLRSVMEAAAMRLDSLDQHIGSFSNTTDTIYYKYRYIGSELSYDEGIKGYVIDSICYTRPSSFDVRAGWCKKSVFESYAGRELDKTNYILYAYDHPEYLDSHQLWPIFMVNIGTSNGLLWNDYNY